MKLLDREQIAAALDLETALERVEQSFRLYSKGQVTAPPVTYLGFENPPGDCHIKSAHLHGEPVFAIKVATGFYDNPSRGLPSSNGLVIVISATTGMPLALLQDEGLLTDVRTGLAGVVATSLACPKGPGTVGIVGSGIQARLQLEYLHKLKGPVRARVWGRSPAAVDRYLEDMRSKGVEIEACDSIGSLCAECDTLITTTPSTTPLIESDWVRAGTHITAVGADAEGKQELDAALFARASGVLVDSREQCVDHADTHHAVVATIIQPDFPVEIGEALDGMSWRKNPAGDITIADLSGLGASDAIVAQAVLSAIPVPTERTLSQGPQQGSDLPT